MSAVTPMNRCPRFVVEARCERQQCHTGPCASSEKDGRWHYAGTPIFPCDGEKLRASVSCERCHGGGFVVTLEGMADCTCVYALMQGLTTEQLQACLAKAIRRADDAELLVAAMRPIVDLVLEFSCCEGRDTTQTQELVRAISAYIKAMESYADVAAKVKGEGRG